MDGGVAIVTGGGTGIGAAVVRRLAARGEDGRDDDVAEPQSPCARTKRTRSA